ncbi:MAG: hypothetical protein ACP5NF_07015 [Thermoanaerobaculum sp.]
MGKRPRHSLVEYFLAAVGLAFLAFILAIVLAPGSCKVEFNPDADKGWGKPTPVSRP